MRLFLIAGGPSVADYDLNALQGHGELVGVNDAGMFVPGVSTVITMDRLWTENRWLGLAHKTARFIVRESVWQRMQAKIDAGTISRPSNLQVESIPMDHTQSTLSLEPGKLNGRNSGFCAFNWAVQQKPTEIYLFGFDMTCQGEKRHWYEPYSWSTKPKNHYGHWAADFDEAKPLCDKLGIKVFNCSSVSRIEAFPKLVNTKAVLRQLEA